MQPPIYCEPLHTLNTWRLQNTFTSSSLSRCTISMLLDGLACYPRPGTWRVRKIRISLNSRKNIQINQKINGPLCPFGLHLPTKLQTWITCANSLKPINELMATGEINNCCPRYEIPQTCGGKKSSCLVCIRPTNNVQSQPWTCFRINERWPNKYRIHTSWQSTKDIMSEEFDGVFLSSKAINWS